MKRQSNKSIIMIFLCILLHFSILIIKTLIPVPDDKLQSVYTMLVVGIVYYVIFLLLLFWFERCLSLVFVFVLVTACFTLGQHIVLFFDPTKPVFLIQNYGIPMKVYFDTLFFILICVDWIILAYCLFSELKIRFVFGRKSNKTEINDKVNNENIGRMLYLTGITVFIVSLPFTLYYLYENIRLTALLGYQGRMGMEQSARNYVAIIATAFPVSIYMILLASFNNKFKRNICLAILGVYSVLYMLAGSRLNIIKIIVVLVVFFYFKQKKLNMKNFVKLGIIAYLMVTLLTTLSYYRSKNSQEYDLVNYLTTNDPVLSILEETGVTFTTIANVINNCPERVEPVYGKTYVNQFFVIVPNLFFEKNPFQVTLNETFNPLYHYGGLSSSMFAEAYYNLLEYGYVYMIVIGWVLSKCNKSINNSSNLFSFLVATYVYSELIWAIRFDTYLILRSVIYYIIIPYFVINNLLKRKISINVNRR